MLNWKKYYLDKNQKLSPRARVSELAELLHVSLKFFEEHFGKNNSNDDEKISACLKIARKLDNAVLLIGDEPTKVDSLGLASFIRLC